MYNRYKIKYLFKVCILLKSMYNFYKVHKLLKSMYDFYKTHKLLKSMNNFVKTHKLLKSMQNFHVLIHRLLLFCKMLLRVSNANPRFLEYKKKLILLLKKLNCGLKVAEKHKDKNSTNQVIS